VPRREARTGRQYVFYGLIAHCDSRCSPAAGPEPLRAQTGQKGVALELGEVALDNRRMKYDIPLRTLAGKASSLDDYRGKALLIVNVASKCGLTPQYAGLEALQERYSKQGFSVLGFPCNQFGAQEPGTADQISEFCTTNYGVTFPMFEKVAVNGPDRHPLYSELTAVADGSGKAGDIEWNFEKFVVSKDGTVRRFRPKTKPDDPELVAAIEAGLP
jgi:glutathione peroxidase